MEKNPMGYKPVFPLLLQMALPPMISMLIESLYNIVDSIFVARVSNEALTAVSLIYPLQNLSLAISCGIGIALNAFVARYLGANDKKRASYYASQGVIMSLLHSLIFVLIGLFLIRPFLLLFTHNPQVIKDGVSYGMIVVTFVFGQFIHLAIEKLFQATGNMMLPMIMQIFGCLVNVCLDPILIFGYFGMPALGIIGAALATVIGQTSAAILSICLFKKYNQGIHLSFKKIDLHIFKQLYSIAFPSSVMMCLPSLLVSLLNGILATIGQNAVAFFGIYYKLQTFVYMPANGVVQGMRPIMSFNYGAGLKDRMNQLLKAAGMMIGLILSLGTLLFMFFPHFLLSLFDASQAMYGIGMTGLRILSLSFVISIFGILMSGVFESLGMGKQSLIITLLRQLIVSVPLAYLLVHIMGITGVWIALVLGEALAGIVSFVFYQRYYCQLKK